MVSFQVNYSMFHFFSYKKKFIRTRTLSKKIRTSEGTDSVESLVGP